MAQHLTDQSIENIVELLDYWPLDEKLTWERLCKAIELQLELMPAPTRQTLQKYARIKNSYDQCKRSPTSAKINQTQKLPASLKIAQTRIEALEAKNARLEKENTMLLEQFVMWQYNAHKYGLSIAKLNEPMSKKSSD
jgi:predicted nuclease with TOPRIM domain